MHSSPPPPSATPSLTASSAAGDSPPSPEEDRGGEGIQDGTRTRSHISSTESDPDPSHEDLGPCPYASEPVKDSDRVASTGQLTLKSKRTERLRKRQEKKSGKRARNNTTSHGVWSQQPLTLDDLPYDVLFDILAFLRPSDLITFSRSSRSWHAFIWDEQAALARAITSFRYRCIEPCFRPPVLLGDVDPSFHWALLHPDRQAHMGIHKKFQHIRPPDCRFVCTCLTCILRWNSLCIVVDFAHWQRNLDEGEPIPLIPRGTFPEWNERLVAAHADVVSRAVASPLWYALVLERHLASTANSIRRHGANKGNRRRRYAMTPEEAESGTDAFLERKGPPTVDFPYHRDNFYMLEAYLPNRGWRSEDGRWLHMQDWHERDLHMALRWCTEHAGGGPRGDGKGPG